MSLDQDLDFSKNATLQMDEATPINILKDSRFRSLVKHKPTSELANQESPHNQDQQIPENEVIIAEQKKKDHAKAFGNLMLKGFNLNVQPAAKSALLPDSESHESIDFQKKKKEKKQKARKITKKSSNTSLSRSNVDETMDGDGPNESQKIKKQRSLKRQDSAKEYSDSLKKLKMQKGEDMKKRRKRFMFYPTDETFIKSYNSHPLDMFKIVWDIFLGFVLIFVCIVIPYRISFVPVDSQGWKRANWVIDGIFLMDMILIFNSAFLDSDHYLHDDRKEIAKSYMSGWFLFDLLAIVPFDLFVSKQNANVNDLIRITRIGRMYRLVKLVRLLKISKIVQSRGKFMAYLSLAFKAQAKVVFYIFGFSIFIHILSSLWALTSVLTSDENQDQTWMSQFPELKNFDLYLTAFYWIIQTITTVGYGDMPITTVAEKVFGIFIMLVGVITFSFATGALSSIISDIDQKASKIKGKYKILKSLQEDCYLPLDLYNRLQSSIKFQSQFDTDDIDPLVEGLPSMIKTELSLCIHEETWQNTPFLQSKSMSFISWICPLLKPYILQDDDYVFYQGDELLAMFFMKQGQCSFVLPGYDNLPYIKIPEGSHFGMEDLVTCIEKIQQDTNGDNWIQFKSRLIRQSTVQAMGINNEYKFTTTLQLTVGLIYRMKIEFKEIYDSLYQEAKKRRDKFIYLKVSVSTKCGLIQKLQLFASKFKKQDGSPKRDNKIKYNIDNIDLYDLVPPQIEEEEEESDEEGEEANADKLGKLSGNTKGKTVNRSENSVLTFLGNHRKIASEDIKVKDLENSFNKMGLLIQSMNEQTANRIQKINQNVSGSLAQLGQRIEQIEIRQERQNTSDFNERGLAQSQSQFFQPENQPMLAQQEKQEAFKRNVAQMMINFKKKQAEGAWSQPIQEINPALPEPENQEELAKKEKQEAYKQRVALMTANFYKKFPALSKPVQESQPAQPEIQEVQVDSQQIQIQKELAQQEKQEAFRRNVAQMMVNFKKKKAEGAWSEPIQEIKPPLPELEVQDMLAKQEKQDAFKARVAQMMINFNKSQARKSEPVYESPPALSEPEIQNFQQPPQKSPDGESISDQSINV